MGEVPEYLRITYISRRRPLDSDAASTEVWDILQVARRRNPEVGLTGGLFSGSRFFAQILEGPAGAVEDRFQSILADPRHEDVVVVGREAVDERLYPDWAMGLAWFDSERTRIADERLEQLHQTMGTGSASEVSDIILSSVADLPIR